MPSRYDTSQNKEFDGYVLYQKGGVIGRTCCGELIFKCVRFLCDCVRSTRVRNAANTAKCLERNKSLRVTKIKCETLKIKFETLKESVK